MALAAVALSALAAPAFAAEEEPAPADDQPPATFAPGEEPALVVDLDAEPAEPGPQWTYRFLIPTTIALAVVVVVITVVQYFLRVVRARYQTQ